MAAAPGSHGWCQPRRFHSSKAIATSWPLARMTASMCEIARSGSSVIAIASS